MPASRSRTEHWKDSLVRVMERGGGVEICVARPAQPDGAPGGADVPWRVRVLGFNEREMIVEQPGAFGESLAVDPGVAVIGAITVGQNRWMFHTSALAVRAHPGAPGGTALVLAMPTGVERCTRRGSHRISTAALVLPRVQCWALLDPASARAAEEANRLWAASELSQEPEAGDSLAASMLLPVVGPPFLATLLNVSGGGIGLRLDPGDGAKLDRRTPYWVRADLRPEMPAPLVVTVRLAHTHVDSTQSTYAGFAFDFTHNPGHREFVAAQMGAYLARLQAAQSARAA